MRTRDAVKKNFFCQDGMVLVMALWVLAILSVFALSIGLGVRQKLTLVSRLEKRDAIHYVARAAVQLARSVFANLPHPKAAAETAQNKKFKHNHPEMFQAIFIDEGVAEVSYLNYDYGLEQPMVLYGLEDESGKLNVNDASLDELTRLFMLTAGIAYETARDVASAIIDWRSDADHTVSGFYGDDYYSNLNSPYQPKRAGFEILEEILLVKGMNPEIFRYAKDFLTVYGDGRVNINTASRPVFHALGLTPEFVDTLILGRNGQDQIPATDDDFIFHDTGVSLRVTGFLPLTPEELAQIDLLYTQKKISTVSEFLQARVKAVHVDGKEIRFIDCIFKSPDGKIVSWREY